MNTTNTGNMLPIAVSIPEAMRLTGLGRSTIYRLIDANRLPRVKVGVRTLIPFEPLHALATGKVAA